MFEDGFKLLFLAAAADEEGVVSIYYDEVFYAQSGDEAAVAGDEAAFGANEDGFLTGGGVVGFLEGDVV